MRYKFPFFNTIQARKFSTISSRKLLLIALDWTRPKDPPLSLGHASILSCLKKSDIPVIERSFAVNKPDFTPEVVIKHIMANTHDTNTDLAIGAYVWNEAAVQKILPEIRRQGFEGRIILGGPQISYLKRGVEQYYPWADIFIRGYAEHALTQLMAHQQSKPVITGVHYANEPDLGKSALINFDEVPSPFLTGIIKPQHFIRWESQRGCPFQCAFCQHRGTDSSQKRRHLETSRVMAEIEWITKHPIIQDIAVLDPTFNSGNNYLNILNEFYRKGYSGKLSLQARMEMVIPEFLDIVEKLNQQGQTVLEFGLQTIHKNEQLLIDRPNNMKKVVAVLQQVKQRKIPIEVSLIFGLPGQTVKSFKESIDFCKDYGVETIHAFPLMLLRGTPMFDNKHKFQLIESCDVQIDEIQRIQRNIPHVISSNSFTFQEWQEMASMAAALEQYNREMALNPRIFSP